MYQWLIISRRLEIGASETNDLCEYLANDD